MPEITRLEAREGFWHAVIYEVSFDATSAELWASR
jgi:hypothetical protein